ncbi:MAG: phosphate acyltransferase PlsX [Planctomycetota bacterium]|nr:phosphate acyltransferase PlsX [Planctomycetota bacterium]
MAPTRIALDVMGGDNAPDAILRGALAACDPAGRWKMPPARILLVGDEALIRARLAALGGDPGFAILHASQVIGMGESPATALRGKPDSSIAKMIGATKAGAAGAAVSMGNTGAVVGAATIGLGTLPGVLRPGIAVTLKLTGKPLTLMDMGALLEPKPESLMQFGIMGSVWSRDILGVAEPRVGLLNVGEEEGKGTDTLKAAWKLLKNAPVRFSGNVEGHDLFVDKIDVVVTDGFTGNVVLKLLEEFAGFMLKLTLGELGAHGVKVQPAALAGIKKHIDYSEYGGALLLGVNGIVIIGHGRSDETAVANALALGARALDADVNAHIVAGLERAKSTSPAA